MPEGDTLRKLASFMAPRLEGVALTAVHVANVPQPELARRRVLRVSAHGKHLLVQLAPQADGWTLRVHLGMHGSWHSYPPGRRWQRPRHLASVVLTTEAGVAYVCYAAEDVACLRTGEAPHDPTLRALGPNLLDAVTPSGEATLDAVAAQLARAAPDLLLIDLLLNQSVAAGLGNVYKSELLFYFGLAPTLRLRDVSPAVALGLYRLGMHWLACNLGGWARTTTYDRRTGPRPELPRLYVYARAKAPCLRCQTPIVRALRGRHRRSTYWCPQCQHTPAP